MLATDLMRQVSYLTDNTIAQANSSKTQYLSALAHLEPYKRILDVYTSRWFGNPMPKKGKADNVRLFLKQHDVEHWLKDPAYTLSDSLIPANDIAQTALQAAADKHFFHWELEFPEVFFAPRTPGGQDVQLKEDGGFDAVVGNPPYFSISTMPSDEQYHLKHAYAHVHSGNSDILYYFLSLVTTLPTQSGILSFIVARYFQESKYAATLRRYLSENARLTRFVDFQNFQVFGPDVNVLASLVFLAQQSSDGEFVSLQLKDDTLPEDVIAKGLLGHNESIFEMGDRYFVSRDKPWFFKGEVDDIDKKIEHGAINLSEIATVVQSMQTGRNAVLAPPKAVIDQYKIERELLHPIAKSGSITRYEFEAIDAVLIWTEGIDIDKFPNAKRYLEQFRDDLAERYDIQNRNAKWWEISNPRSADLFFSAYPRILVPFVATGNKFCVDDSIRLNDGGDLRAVFFNRETLYSEYFICAVLNSFMLDGYHKRHTKLKRGGYYEYFEGQLSKLPIPRIDFTTPPDLRERQTAQIVAAYDLGDHARVQRRVGAALDAGQTDVVHDVLAHLAQHMIDLNKDKQAEVKRFLGWLEDQLKITPKDGVTGLDVFTGKTIIQNYLGDYQKGESELPFPAAGSDDSLEYRLYQNRNRYRTNLDAVRGVIEAEYEQSLDTLRPIKRDLARTDALIDKIVYRLYGLTDDEIELIERPQYEQALADAKAQVVADEKIGDEEKIEKIAEGILPAAKRFFERVEPRDVEATLDAELPGWRDLPPDAPVFLVTGDYNLRSLPDHMDFSSSVIPYTKAVEVVLHQRIFEPFKAAHSPTDASNSFLQAFLRGEKNLTLGSYMIILSSSKEVALRSFVARSVSDLDGLVTVLSDEAVREVRNKAAHDEVLSRDEARQARAWALGVLGVV